MYEIQNNVLSIIIALILYFSLRAQTYRSEHVNKFFFVVLWANIAILALESTLLLLSGTPGAFVHTVMIVVLLLYYLMSPVLAFLCVLYLEFDIYKNEYSFRKRYIYFIFVVIVSMIFTFLSVRGNYIFELTSDNHFLYGTMNIYYVIFLFISVIIGLILSVNQMKYMQKKDLTPMLLFIVTPVIAIIFFLIYRQSTLIWNSITISLLISYIFVQLRISNTDYLTGLFNRREFEYQLARVKNNSSKNEKIYGMIIDLDDFKLINDLYGHAEGDLALREIGLILQASVRKQDFVSRIGGDEFAIILSAKGVQVIESIVERIKLNLQQFNQENDCKYNLKLSYGYDFYDEEKFQTVIDFFNHIDMKMYLQKHGTKKTKKA